MSTYSDIEDGIIAAIGPDVSGSPFVSVVGALAGMSDVELAEEMKKYSSAQTAPAALILYAGGDSNSGFAGDLECMEEFQVAVIAAKPSRELATLSTFELLDYVIGRLHGLRNTLVKNPLRWRGNARMRIPDVPLTVAAYVARFGAETHRAETVTVTSVTRLAADRARWAFNFSIHWPLPGGFSLNGLQVFDGAEWRDVDVPVESVPPELAYIDLIHLGSVVQGEAWRVVSPADEQILFLNGIRLELGQAGTIL